MNKKTLKEHFETYRPPVNEAGWARLDSDPALIRNRRIRKLHKFLPIGAAGITIAAVAVALCIALPRPERTATAVADTAQPATSAAHDGTAATTALPLPRPEATASATSNTIAAPAATAATAPAHFNGKINRPDETVPVPAPGNSTERISLKPLSPVAGQPVLSVSPLPTLRLATMEPKTADTDIQETSTDTIGPAPTNVTEPTRLFLAPNAFTPNNDGINDLFLLQCNEPCTFFELDVYTRNGENIFSTKHIDQGWNGKRLDNGDPLPQSVYVYTVKYRTAEGKSGTEHGQILLIR